MALKIKCEFCDSYFTKKGYACHISRAHSDLFLSKINRQFYVNKIIYSLTDDMINKIILDYEKNSLLSLYDKYSVPYGVIKIILKINNIPIKNMTEALSLSNVKNKKKKTSLINYGFENPSQSFEIKEKKKKTFIKNYGVDNIWKFEGFIKSINDIMIEKYGVKRLTNVDKAKETSLERYGTLFPMQNEDIHNKQKMICYEKYGYEYPIQSDFFKNKLKETINSKTDEEKRIIGDKISVAQKNIWINLSLDEKAKKLKNIHNIKISSIETRIGIILSNLNIDFTHSFYIKQHKYTFQYDYLLSDIPIIIEVNGDFWHANPKFYGPNDKMCFPVNAKLAKQIWKKDRMKSNIAKNKGYYVIYIWESEIKNNCDENIINILTQRIGDIIDAQNGKNKVNKED